MLCLHVFREVGLAHPLAADRTVNFGLVDVADVLVEVAALLAAVRARHCRDLAVTVVFGGLLFSRQIQNF